VASLVLVVCLVQEDSPVLVGSPEWGREACPVPAASLVLEDSLVLAVNPVRVAHPVLEWGRLAAHRVLVVSLLVPADSLVLAASPVLEACPAPVVSPVWGREASLVPADSLVLAACLAPVGNLEWVLGVLLPADSLFLGTKVESVSIRWLASR
jgi:hypothetical protein